ncbi:transferase [Desulfosarcina alkanivorans]|uniref:Transferase n=1 Tax=Desulfosarcina alkanivorans TaxID=571177 RepID=A0A5K7YRW4_9BACT|nr:glycosyltransferase family 4 protein [Desulfosarcina alkanivorans]BBO72562.1 transferase [Desulfosarcina alkanivorans]
MKIALLVKHFTRSGGKERYVVELAGSLQQLGHTIHVYAYDCDPDLTDRITFHGVRKGMPFSSVLNTLSFIRESRKRLAFSTYDIIHSHERNYTQEIVTLHSLSFVHGVEKYSCLRQLDQKYFSPRSLLYLWLEKQQMKSPWLVTVSGEVSRDVTKHYGRSHQIVCIPPGADVNRFSPAAVAGLRDQARQAHHLEKDELAVLFVGSAFQRKGLDRVLPAIQGKRRLFVVGRGDRHARYHRLIRQYGLEDRVVFTDMVDDVVPYYALADVVVLPSRSEAFGMSVLEGMACGLPVVVTPNAGVADLIVHGENGLIMQTDVGLDRYLDFLGKPEERRRLGENARQTAQAHTWEQVGLLHEAFYRQLIANRG